MPDQFRKVPPKPPTDEGQKGNGSNGSNGSPDDAGHPPITDLPEPSLTPAERKLRDELTEWYQMVAMMIVSPIDILGGQLLALRADELATQWVVLSRNNPSIKAALKKLLSASGWAGIAASHMMILLPVMANRGAFPDQWAAGIAMATIAQDPAVGPLFNHPRWRDGQGQGQQ